MKIIGVLGGMGPQATLYFYELLIQTMLEKHGIEKNADFFHILIDSIPVPDLVRSRAEEEKTVEIVAEEAKRLKAAGASFLVMPCNTMHLYADRLATAAEIPLHSMVESVLTRVRQDKRKRIGLLGSLTTMKSKLYLHPLEKLGIEVVLPAESQREGIANLIHATIAGKAGQKEENTLLHIIQELQKDGAQAVILGCTELPLLARSIQSPIPVYNSLEILAEEACSKASFC